MGAWETIGCSNESRLLRKSKLFCWVEAVLVGVVLVEGFGGLLPFSPLFFLEMEVKPGVNRLAQWNTFLCHKVMNLV